MKTNGIFLHRRALAALLVCLLSASSLTTRAQTYNGRLRLDNDPTKLEANVYPQSNRLATINVIFINPTGAEVRVIIRNGQGKVYYDDYSSVAQYRRKFDLSELPVGSYTVELTGQESHFIQTLAINPPATNWITMDPPSGQAIPDFILRNDKRLTINQ